MDPLPFGLVDPHIHQWDPRTTPRLVSPAVRLFGFSPRLLEAISKVAFPRPALDFVGVTDYVRSSFLPADYAKDARGLGIEVVGHVQAGWQDHSALGAAAETRWVASLPFDGHGLSLGAIVGEGDPTAKSFVRLLDAHREGSPRFRGIRKMASRHPDPGVYDWETRDGLYQEPAFLRGFEELAARGLTFDAWVYSHQLVDLAALAQRFPESPIVLDHLGTPAGVFGPVGRRTGASAGEREAILAAWKDGLARVASNRNVYAKLSGLLMPVLGHDEHRRGVRPSADVIRDRIRPLVDHALDVFGPERCMWASNFPMDKAVADLSAIVEAYAAIVAERGEPALRAVFRENALRFYRMPVS